MTFYAGDGLFFRRNYGGSVTITKTADGRAVEDGGVAVFQQTVPAGAWLSSVLSMTAFGERPGDWLAFVEHHNGVTDVLKDNIEANAKRGEDAVQAFMCMLADDSRGACAFMLGMSDAELREATDAALALVRLATRRRRLADGSTTFAEAPIRWPFEQAKAAGEVNGHLFGAPYAMRDGDAVFTARDCTHPSCCARLDSSAHVSPATDYMLNGYGLMLCPAPGRRR